MGFVYKIICLEQVEILIAYQPYLCPEMHRLTSGKVYRENDKGELESLLGPDKTNDGKFSTPDNEKSAERLHAEKTNACTNCCNNMTLRDLLLCTFIWSHWL